MRKFALRYLAPLALLLGVVIVPLASGERTLFLRDTLMTHFSMRAGLVAPLRAGEMPFVDPLRGGGQALAGNLNAVPFYPDNLLLLFTSPLWQLNAHFWLHWIVALAAAFWLGRALGWGRPAALATALAYAFSGYFVSQLNLYNAVAPVALAPALAAAAIELGRGVRSRRAVVAFALIWTLSLLGGDPIVAGLALLAAMAMAYVERGRLDPDSHSWSSAASAASPAVPIRGALRDLALALFCGTALAAPQLLATRALLAESYRGFSGFDAADLARAAPSPPALLELFLPLFFGRPDSGVHWGNAYFGGTPPLYFSLAPGALVLALVYVALGSGHRAFRLPAGLALAGLLLTFSAGTPVSGWLGALPGMGLVRFQAKFALLFALGVALLAGLGAERLRLDPDAARRMRRGLAAMGAVYLALFAFLAARPGALFRAFVAQFGRGLPEALLETEAKRWTGVALLMLGAIALAGLALSKRFEKLDLALPVLLALQVGLQLLLLRGILPTDEAAVYRTPPALLAALPAESRIAHGAANGIFGPGLRDAPGTDPRLAAQVRRAWQSGFPFAAHAAGRRTELDSAPEGLDHFTLLATEDALEQLPDPERVRLLRATGVDRLLLPRALEGVDRASAPILSIVTELVPPLAIHEVAGGWGEARLVPCVSYAPHMNAALARILAEDFDPLREAVVRGTGSETARRCVAEGSARIVRDRRETVELEVDAPEGGVLVLRRAFLPIWRVEVDGRPAATLPAEMTRLAVELPAGARRVRFHVDRSPLNHGLWIALCGALVLVLRVALVRSSMSTVR